MKKFKEYRKCAMENPVAFGFSMFLLFPVLCMLLAIIIDEVIKKTS